MNRLLAQLGRQCLGIWKQLGLNQRLSVGMAGALVLAFLVTLAFWSGRVDYALLYGGLEEAEAARVIGVLEDMKVPHRIGLNGGSIQVPRDKVHHARMQLAAKGLPRGDGVGFEIFDKPNFGISDFVQRANYLRAVQGELARTINQLDEVVAARVMIVVPENRLLVDNQRRATASVFVRTKEQGPLPSQAVQAIQFLVANSVEGLRPSQVTVVDNRGHVLSQNQETDSIAGLTTSQIAARRSLEDYLAKKAESMLETVLGPGQAVVRVAAEVNFDSLTRTEERFDPDNSVVRTETIEDETVDSSNGTSGGGVPGVVSNLGLDTNYLSVPTPAATANRTRKKVTSNEYEISKITSNLTQLAGDLKRVSAAVFIAARYDGIGPDRKMVPRTQQELDKLRRIVQSALGAQVPQTGSARTGVRQDEITLEEMAFSDPPGNAVQDLDLQERNQFWWNQLVNGCYLALALVLLLVFWRLLKKTPLEPVPFGAHLGPRTPGTPPGNGRGHPAGSGEEPDILPAGVPSIDLFNRLVRENPENLNQAIQNWLDRGNPTHPHRS